MCCDSCQELRQKESALQDKCQVCDVNSWQNSNIILIGASRRCREIVDDLSPHLDIIVSVLTEVGKSSNEPQTRDLRDIIMRRNVTEDCNDISLTFRLLSTCWNNPDTSRQDSYDLANIADEAADKCIQILTRIVEAIHKRSIPLYTSEAGLSGIFDPRALRSVATDEYGEDYDDPFRSAFKLFLMNLNLLFKRSHKPKEALWDISLDAVAECFLKFAVSLERALAEQSPSMDSLIAAVKGMRIRA
jgi:hypothetical protein